MSLQACLPGLVARGELSQEQAERLGALYDEAYADLAGKLGPDTAAAGASDLALQRFKAEAQQAKRQALLQVSAQSRILRDTANFKGEARGEAFIGVLTHSDRAPYQNADTLRRVIEMQAHGMMAGVLDKHSRNLLGQVRNRASLENMVREAFGEATGDVAAKELADAWGQTAEMLRTRFNAAGGSIGKLERWGLPQVHDQYAIRSTPYSEWRDFIAPLLDRERITDPDTGLPISPQGLERALDSIYRNVGSDGWATRKPGERMAGGKLGNRHAESRFLVFRDATSWMEYNRRFGRPRSALSNLLDPEGSIFDAMMGHIASMSRDIALMETLGPNPTATVRWMNDILDRETNLAPTVDRYSQGRSKLSKWVLNDVYAELAGTGMSPIATRWGTLFGAARAMQTAGKLGSAVITATTDIGFQATTRAFNGMPVTKALTGYLRQFNPMSSVDRELAARIGFAADEVARSAVAQSRMVGETLTGEMASRLAEGVLRASGLSAWTAAGKRAFMMDFLSHVTGERAKAWGTLGTPFRGVLQRYGFTPAAWDALRSTPLEKVGAGSWIIPGNIEDRALRERLLGMIASETQFAIPEANLTTRALINQNLPPKGTIAGELLRSPLQFKAFGISMLMTHGQRMMSQQTWGKLRYGAGLTITTGLLGAFANQMGYLSRGEDPQPMEDPTFWAQALLKGGGFGLAGDFLQSATDKYDGTLSEYLGGPVFGDISRSIKIAKSGVKAAQGQKNSAGRQLVRLIQGDLPGSSLWYSKLAFQRAVADQAQRWADPNYYEAFARMENRARQQGQDYWWRPGDVAPERAPDLSTALTSPPPR